MLPGQIELSEELIRHLKVESITEDRIVLKHDWRDVKITITASESFNFDVEVGDN